MTQDQKTAEAEAWRALVQAAHRWASHHMDQWEKLKFETPYGTVFFTLSHRTDHPDAFDSVDADGQALANPDSVPKPPPEPLRGLVFIENDGTMRPATWRDT